MYLTREILLTLHAEITAEAYRYGAMFGLQRCDVEDIIGNAYLTLQARLPKYHAECKRSLIKASAHNEVLEELTKRNNRENQRWENAYRLDAPLDDSDDAENDEDSASEFEGEFLSDNGKGEADIVSFDEPPEPDYVYLFRAQYQRERGMPRKVIDAFKKTWFPHEVYTKLGITWRVFYKIIKKLQVRFALCLCAYHEYLNESKREKK